MIPNALGELLQVLIFGPSWLRSEISQSLFQEADVASSHKHGDQGTHVRTELHVDGRRHQKTLGDAGDVKLFVGIDIWKVHAPSMASLKQKIREVHYHEGGVKNVIQNIEKVSHGDIAMNSGPLLIAKASLVQLIQ